MTHPKEETQNFILLLKNFNQKLFFHLAKFNRQFFLTHLNSVLTFLLNHHLEFKIFFPPYSILTWKSWEHHKYLQDMLEFKKYILRQSIKYKNVKLYDFQIAKEITHNLDNYKDISHYSGKMNRWMVQQIKENNYLITKNNIDKYLKTLKEQIKNYDLNQTLSK